MRQFLKNTGLFLLPFLVAVVYLWCRPYPEKFAYNYIHGSCFNRGQYVYDRIFESQRPLDIAFVGTSHTMNTVNDSLIELRINGNGQPYIYVANISYCWEGLNGQYVIIKDIIENKSPKIIVLEVREHEHKTNHEIFPYVCDTHDALFQPYLTNATCLTNLYKSTEARFNLFTNGDQYFHIVPDTTHRYGINPNADVPAPGVLENEQEMQRLKYGDNGKLLDYHMTAFSRFYFDKIIDMCQTHHIRLCFLYLPSYGDILNQPLDADLYKKYGTLLLPPDEIRQQNDVWANGSHMNIKGQQQISEWVANYFINEKNKQ